MAFLDDFKNNVKSILTGKDEQWDGLMQTAREILALAQKREYERDQARARVAELEAVEKSMREQLKRMSVDCDRLWDANKAAASKLILLGDVVKEARANAGYIPSRGFHEALAALDREV